LGKLQIITEPELLAGGFDPMMLFNVNTPEDLATAEARLH
jgi:molybdopterin-guanine dinucleotide biosynthesis protein A